MIKKCEWCGKEFDAPNKVRKYCCEDCSKRAKNERSKEYQRQKSDEKPKTILKCQICGTEFVSKWGAVVCSNPCREEYQRRVAHDYYEQHYQPKMRKCVVCGKEFVVKHNFKVCSTECRTVRDKQKAKEFYEKYKPKALKRKAEHRARLKAEEPPVDYRHLKLDGKVLDKAQMTVDEYNRTHGTNYSYGQYVHFVERNLSQKAEPQCEDERIKQMIYLRDVKKLSWTNVAMKMGIASGDTCRMMVKRYLESKGV